MLLQVGPPKPPSPVPEGNEEEPSPNRDAGRGEPQVLPGHNTSAGEPGSCWGTAYVSKSIGHVSISLHTCWARRALHSDRALVRVCTQCQHGTHHSVAMPKHGVIQALLPQIGPAKYDTNARDGSAVAVAAPVQHAGILVAVLHADRGPLQHQTRLWHAVHTCMHMCSPQSRPSSPIAAMACRHRQSGHDA